MSRFTDQTGNPFQRTLDYRGFVASPVQGTPQGIAVYQNGVRINESFGDVVNWDFIPEKAIDGSPSSQQPGVRSQRDRRCDQHPDEERFHLSRGRSGVVRRLLRARAGQRSSRRSEGKRLSLCGVRIAYDRGWRDYANSSHVNRMYVDVGARNDQTELHVNFTGADNLLGNVAATPIQMLNQRWSSVYTWPQTTRLQLAFLNTTLNHTFSDTWSFQSNAYFRGFRQSHVDGNGTDAKSCNRGANLCIDGVHDNNPIFGPVGGPPVPE